MAFYKLVSLIVVAYLSGLGAMFGFVSAQANIITTLDTVYVVYATVASSIIFAILVRYTKLRTMKSSTFICLSLAVFISLLLFTNIFIGNPSIRAFIWFILAYFIVMYFSWAYGELIVRNFNPAVVQTYSSLYTAGFETGSMTANFSILLGIMTLQTINVMFMVAILFFIVITVLLLTFSSKRNIEINYDKNAVETKEAPEEAALFSTTTKFFAAIAFLFSINSFMGDYLLAVVVSENFDDYHEVTMVTTKILIIISLFRIFFNNLVSRLNLRWRISPISMFIICAGTPSLVAVISLFNPQMGTYFVLSICAAVSTDCFFWNGSNILSAFFPHALREKLKATSIISFFIYAGVPLGIFFGFLGTDDKDSLRRTMAIIFLTTFVLILILTHYKKIHLVKTFYANTHSALVGSVVLSIRGLSYLNPSDFVQKMISLLREHPARIVRQFILLNIGFSKKIDKKTTLEILNEFESHKEEVQLAVLEFIERCKNPYAVKFVIEILYSKHAAHSIKVRLFSSQVIANLYGIKAIPLLLEGLIDPDDRIKANAIEILGGFKDESMVEEIEAFANSPIPRIRANALNALGNFKSTREHYHKGISSMLKGTSNNLVASALYVVGQNKDKYFYKSIKKIHKGKMAADPLVRRGLAWALTRMKDIQGFVLFDEFFKTPYIQGKQQDFLHFFGQLSLVQRFDIVEYIVRKNPRNEDLFNNIENHLKNAFVDFHEELDFLGVIRS